jgi:hypothetical protein
MFILPYIRMPERSPGLQQFWLFLERNGSHLIEIDASDNAVEFAKEFAELNGLALLEEPRCIDDIVYCHVEPTKSDISSCYSWKETVPGTEPKEAWRTFLWATAADNTDPWGVNRLMDGISISEKNTVYSVLRRIVDRQALGP